MARASTIKHVRKAGAFVDGELAAGEWGLDVSNSHWYYSGNGTTVVQFVAGSGTVDTANSPNANEFARFTDADTIEGRTVSETKADLSLDNVSNVAQLPLSYLDTDGTLAANSDAKVPSQKAVKTAIAAAVTGLFDFQGSTDTSANPNYPAASKGDAYVVTVAGKIGGASGKSVDVGDVYLATADNAGGNEATVGTSWTVLEHNLIGAYVAGGTDVPVTDGGTGASTAAGARGNLGTDDAANITSGNLATARMQTNVVAAINAGGGTINGNTVIIDCGTL